MDRSSVFSRLGATGDRDRDSRRPRGGRGGGGGGMRPGGSGSSWHKVTVSFLGLGREWRVEFWCTRIGAEGCLAEQGVADPGPEGGNHRAIYSG